MLNTGDFSNALQRLFPGVANLTHFAEAAALLSDETRVKEAFKRVDARLLELAKKNNYFLRPGGGVEQRILARPAAARYIDSGQMFSFSKPLQEMERHYGFTDKRRTFIGFVPDATFRNMVSAGEVWKDSISLNHGEYTHRLQWLAIAEGAYIGRKTLLPMYQESLALSALPMRDRNPRTGTTLWDFVLDCFPTTGTAFTESANTGDAAGDGNVGRYITTTTFRSPGNTTAWLRASDTVTPFITGYLKSSEAKLDLARKGAQQYRVDKILAKHGIRLRGPNYRGEKDVVFTPADDENWAGAIGDSSHEFWFDGSAQRQRL